VTKKIQAGVVITLLGGGLLFAPTQAGAVGGSCHSNMEKEVRDLSPDAYRVRAICSSLDSDTKARGVLDRPGNDCETVWFTTVNKSYYSGWCTSGRGTFTKLAQR
jgi:hypothetical protein